MDLGHFTVVLANFIAAFRLYSDNLLDYDDDFFKRKVKEALLIRQKSNFNQDSGLAVSPIWLSLL